MRGHNKFYADYPLLATKSPCFLELLGEYFHIFLNMFYIKIIVQDGHNICFNSKNSIHQHVHEDTFAAKNRSWHAL